jgi:hypothetical protein
VKLPIEVFQIQIQGKKTIPPAEMIPNHKNWKSLILNIPMIIYFPEIKTRHRAGVPFEEWIIKPMMLRFDDHGVPYVLFKLVELPPGCAW